MLNPLLIEFSAALASLIIAIILYVNAAIRDTEIHNRNPEIPNEYGFLLLVIVVPCLCVVLASYYHSIKNNRHALWFLVATAAANNLLIAVLFVGIAWAYSGWPVLLFVTEFLLVLVAVIAGIIGALRSSSD